MDKALKILICDDSLLMRKKMRDVLEELGCHVFEASDGQAAARLFDEYRPDAVFMDIVMPKADGLQALKTIRALDGNAKVIMLSSVGTASNLMEALKLGAADFIQKPYNNSQIANIIAGIKQRSDCGA